MQYLIFSMTTDLSKICIALYDRVGFGLATGTPHGVSKAGPVCQRHGNDNLTKHSPWVICHPCSDGIQLNMANAVQQIMIILDHG